MSNRTKFKTYQFALVICRNFDGRYLAVNETQNRGWWIPGGAVDAGESFDVAALRETMEEGGIKIKLKGILKIDHDLFGVDQVRMRVIFFAEPIDKKQTPKQYHDKHSLEAQWVTVDQFKAKNNIRGDELIEWGTYIDQGGQIFPLSLLMQDSKFKLDPNENLSFYYPDKSCKKPVYINHLNMLQNRQVQSQEEEKKQSKHSKQKDKDIEMQNKSDVVNDNGIQYNFGALQISDQQKQTDTEDREPIPNQVSQKKDNKDKIIINWKKVIQLKDDKLYQQTVQQCIDQRIDVNIPISAKKLIPMYKAIRNGCSSKTIKMFLEAGSSISYLTTNRRNAFHYAVNRGDPDILQVLLEHLQHQPILSIEQKLDILSQKDLDKNRSPLQLARLKIELEDKMKQFFQNLNVIYSKLQ
eukprot:403339115